MFELNNFQTRISDVAIAAAAKQMILQMDETEQFKMGFELLYTDEKLYEEHFGFNPVEAGKHKKWSQPLPRGGTITGWRTEDIGEKARDKWGRCLPGITEIEKAFTITSGTRQSHELEGLDAEQQRMNLAHQTNSNLSQGHRATQLDLQQMKQVADAEGEIARRTGEDSVKKEPPNLIELDKMGSLDMDDDDDLLAESVGRPKAKAGAKANSGGGSGGGTKRSTDGATSATFAKRNKVGGSGGGGGGGQTIATSGVKKGKIHSILPESETDMRNIRSKFKDDDITADDLVAMKTTMNRRKGAFLGQKPPMSDEAHEMAKYSKELTNLASLMLVSNELAEADSASFLKKAKEFAEALDEVKELEWVSVDLDENLPTRYDTLASVAECRVALSAGKFSDAFSAIAISRLNDLLETENERESLQESVFANEVAAIFQNAEKKKLGLKDVDASLMRIMTPFGKHIVDNDGEFFPTVLKTLTHVKVGSDPDSESLQVVKEAVELFEKSSAEIYRSYRSRRQHATGCDLPSSNCHLCSHFQAIAILPWNSV